MRIITGSARGTRLKTLEGEATRPTGERVKEGLFSALQFEIEGRKVLDLFCGSGQLALEALSRGAASAVMVDASRDAADIAADNARRAGLYPKCRVYCCDYTEYLKSTKDVFDLVFLDPPYAEKATAEIADRLAKSGRLAPGALVVCESDTDGLPEPERCRVRRRYRYGKTFVTMLEYDGEDKI